MKAVRATINPYRHAIGCSLERLKWDLKPESWRSRRVLQSWRNKYDGQKALILCNGPSLRSLALESIPSDIFTFGLNKIYLLFDQNAFRPNCIVAVNPLVIEQASAFYNKTDIPLFLEASALARVKPRPNVAFLHTSDQTKFARDCSVSIQQGFTVTYVALQLAYHMGFSDVAIVGCDHHFEFSGRENAVVEAGARDVNHFHPDYFSGGVKWQLPDLLGSEFFYRMAWQAFESAGRRIVNCTDGGQLELFPRMGVGKWFHEKS